MGYGDPHSDWWEFRSETQRSIPCDLMAKIQNLQFRITSIEDDSHTYEPEELLQSYRSRKDHCGSIMGRLANSMDKANHCHIQLTRQALNHFKHRHIKGVRVRKIFKSVTAEVIDEREQ